MTNVYNSLLYKVEYSVGEQCCKKCDKKFRSRALKIAIMMQSEDDDCQYPAWYHVKCFFTIRLPKTEAAFDGFAKLRYADQQLIKLQLGNVENELKKGTKVQRAKAKPPDFHIEYTRSERDACTGCGQMIRSPEIRIMNVQYVTDLTGDNFLFGGKAIWFHIPCFVRSRYDLGWLDSAGSLPGFKRLSEEDKQLVKKQIPTIKRKFCESIECTDANMSELEKLIESQNLEYYALFDKLAKNVSKKEQIDILNANNQLIPETKTEILHHLTDILYFGALDNCAQCYIGKMFFNNTTYSCSAYSIWGKCNNDSKEPKRRKAYVSYQLCRKFPFLESMSRLHTRALHHFQFEDESGADLANASFENPKLFNMEFAIIGKLKMSHKDIESVIKKMGGRVVNGIHNKLAAVISNEEEIKKMGTKMVEARTCNVQVISEEFLSKLETVDPFSYIINRSLTDWGGNPFLRIDQNVVKSRRETTYYTKSLPEKVTYKLNVDNAQNLVDADSGLQDEAHIYCCDRNGKQVKYIVVLGLVDIQNNKNSFHRMQLLEGNDLKSYWIFEKWGRISTVIGSSLLTRYATAEDACKTFHALYLKKTGNEFGKYAYSMKQPNKLYHLQIDFDLAKQLPKKYVETKLCQPLYQLMSLIFDTKHIEQMMLSCDVDLKQMPLGKIDSNQIYAAMRVLEAIANMITNNGTHGRLIHASNEFYTLIPHGFSVKRPPIIDSIDMVKAKNEMLESLLNMSAIYGFLEGENGEKINPMDSCFQKLKTKIIPIDKTAIEFKEISEIVRNTHGATHNLYTLEVVDVFKLKRSREDVRSRAYKQLENHQMLWHGSRVTNFVSILSKGLRIAPKEAPTTGFMFGKGIYFADIVSKSANYCYPTYGDNVGLLLLCDVALGKTQHKGYAIDTRDLPNEIEQSVKGCGLMYPTEYSQLDGVKIAVGGIQKANFPTALQYNEYVVYDIAQVKMKYLVKLKFNYKN